jgi:hypothetical protein
MEKESSNILAKSTCSDFKFPKPQKLAKKPHQNKRPRTNRTHQYIRTFFFHLSPHYVFRTIAELIEILLKLLLNNKTLNNPNPLNF